MQMELYVQLKIVKILFGMSEDNENIQRENFFCFLVFQMMLMVTSYGIGMNIQHII
jgi:hypothetical protein